MADTERADSEQRELERIIQHVGEDILLRYRDLMVIPYHNEIVLGVSVEQADYSLENASSWVNLASFREWYIKDCQARAPRTPQKSRSSSAAARTSSSPAASHYPPSSPSVIGSVTSTPTITRTITRPTPSRPISLPPIKEELNIKLEIEEASVRDSVLESPKLLTKRKRGGFTVIPDSEIVEISSDEDAPPSRPPSKKPSGGPSRLTTPAAAKKISITQRTKVDRLINITQPLHSYSIPRPNEETFAYLLDLREPNVDQWPYMSMFAIIKAEDHDAWGNPGTAGSSQALTSVKVLDGVKCRLAKQTCQGCWHCKRVIPSLIDGVQRFEPSEDERKAMYHAEQDYNQAEHNSPLSRVVAFYNDIQTSKCTWKDENGNDVVCKGRPVIRNFATGMSNDGKSSFIGCSGYKHNRPSERHRFIGIPIAVNEDELRHIFQHNGKFKNAVHDSATINKECGVILPPRIGAKGQKKCPHTHLRDNGESESVSLVHRRCTATITVYTPDDPTDRRAVIMVNGPHNHPTPAGDKLSLEAKGVYAKAVEKFGAGHATVSKVDRASETRELLSKLSEQDKAALATNTRYKRKLIQVSKQKDAPCGTGFEGVVARQRAEREEKPEEERYIHSIQSVNGVDVIVTLWPSLAGLVHEANATLHDFTYKRVHGKFNEWEVVIFSTRYNMRVTIAWVYCNHETREAFRLIWKGLWDAIANATGRPVKFSFMHGEGIRAIVMDENIAQVQGLGDYLVAQAALEGGKVDERDPVRIVQYILRLCTVHFDRNLDTLSNKLSGLPTEKSKQAMARIRSVTHLKTWEELEEFGKWCKAFECRAVKDWWMNKEPHPWIWAGLNRNLSRMSPVNWDTTPSNTNINESAHTATNAHTGIGLSLLHAIIQAEGMDSMKASEIVIKDQAYLLTNPRQTMTKRMHENRLRNGRAMSKSVAHNAAVKDLEDYDVELAELVSRRRSIASEEKSAKQERKNSGLTVQQREDLDAKIKALGEQRRKISEDEKAVKANIAKLRDAGVKRKRNPAKGKYANLGANGDDDSVGVLRKDADAPCSTQAIDDIGYSGDTQELDDVHYTQDPVGAQDANDECELGTLTNNPTYMSPEMGKSEILHVPKDLYGIPRLEDADLSGSLIPGQPGGLLYELYAPLGQEHYIGSVYNPEMEQELLCNMLDEYYSAYLTQEEK